MDALADRDGTPLTGECLADGERPGTSTRPSASRPGIPAAHMNEHLGWALEVVPIETFQTGAPAGRLEGSGPA